MQKIRFWLKAALILVSLAGVLVHWGIKARFHLGFGGWPEVWRQEFFHFRNTACMSCAIVSYVIGWLYISTPYLITAVGGVLLRSVPAIVVLILLTVGLMYLDVSEYARTNSKDWYMLLSPLLLSAVASGCLLVAWLGGWLVGKASSSNASPQGSEKAGS